MGLCRFLILCIFCGFYIPFKHVHLQNIEIETCSSNDLKSLEAFNEGLQSKIVGWGFSNTRSNGSCCAWVGVVCDESLRVIELNLGAKKLEGELSDSLADLNQLKFLNLSQNSLQGKVPRGLFQLRTLEVLDLSYNDLYGVMLRDIDLPSILFINLSGNTFSGNLNSGICINSSSIQVLDLSVNYLTGTIPEGFGNCTGLEYLGLHSNSLRGNLPEDLFSLRGLSQLHVQFNLLSGFLNNYIGNLSNLLELDISFNGFYGSLPNIFDKLQKLERLSVCSNRLSGTLPTSLLHSSSIKVLSLRNNSLSGLIKFNCTSMVHLNSLDLGTNHFLGPLPDSLSSCRNLRAINLARNNLNSEIPESFKTLQSLSYLSLTSAKIHNISSALYILQHCRSLTTIILTMNFKDEEMPLDANVHFPNLTTLVIAYCRLTGTIPQWLSGSTKLQLLDFSLNNLSGTIPDWLGKMKFLFYLDVSNNFLSGVIPKSLSKLEGLISRNITNFDGSTEFPFFIQRSPTATRGGMQYNKIISFRPSLDLSYNLLNGDIPSELGNLKKLHYLNLSWNHISGSIPSKLSGMRMLEILDLSNNNLTGTIPTSLENLSFLSMLNVAYNNLSGSIPQGGQFSTFSHSSFEGNERLCFDFSDLCLSSQLIPLEPQEAQKSEGVIIATVFGLAVGLPIGIAYGTVLYDPRKKDRIVTEFGSEQGNISRTG